jgi:putative ABC transport system permease protein
MRWLEDARADVHFAARQMRSAPGVALVAIVTLALGIGANGAIFALVDATLLKPLPLPDPDRLVMIWESSDTSTRGRVSPLNAVDWAERNQTFAVISTFSASVGGMVMAGKDGMAENVARQWLPSARIFDVLGVRPIVGRSFLQSDQDQRASVVVLSEAFWRSRFGADLSIVGQDPRLDGALFTVVGVVPNEAQLVGETDLWALRPFGRDPGLRAPRVLLAVGRLKPDVTPDEANADLNRVASALAQEYPAVNAGRGVTLEPLRAALVGSDLRRTSALFIGVVGFVLLICCANVANLLLVRGTVRQRELAMRTALGAGRGRMMRQLLTESLLLSLVGGTVGLALGAAILMMAPSWIPPGLLPWSVALAFDTRVVTFCAMAMLAVGVVFGLAPAWQATRFAPPQASASETRTTAGAGWTLRSALVIGEVATAVLLLFGAGLLLRTLLAVEHFDRGYRADDALTMIVDPLGSRYPTPELLKGFFDDVEREIRALPGVDNVAWASTLPLGPSYAGSFAFEVVGDALPADNERRPADLQIVSPSYFSTLDLPIADGRAFTEHDTRQTVPVCIVNEAFVRTELQGRSPIGMRLSLRPAGAPQATPMVREIVGVARQVKARPDETDDFLQVYVPITQLIMDDIFLLVTSASGRPDALAPSVRAAIGRIDKAQLVSVRDVRTLDDIASLATSRHRFRAVLVTTFAGLALLLSMVGVFGTLSYSVQQRVREFAVRIALGASAGSVVRLVAGSAARVLATGIGLGLVAAAALGRLLSSMLFGVEPLDPPTFVVVMLVLALSAIASTAAPVWRALHVDPAATLRGE